MATRILLLGPVELESADGQRQAFTAERRCQLLVRLAAQPGVWIERDSLAALLWPAHDAAEARRNLRKVIHGARAWPGAAALEVRTHALRWPVQTDLAQLATQADAADLPAELGWRGPPLAGLDDVANAAWTAWLRDERTHLRTRWQQALHTQLQGPSDADTRERLARGLLAADPCDELAARALVAVLQADGRQGEAQRFYRAFARRLEDELGVEPAHALRDLLGAGTPAGTPPQVPAVPEAPARPQAKAFVGRRGEAQELRALLDDGACRLLTVTGPGGIGKSRLVRELLPTLQADRVVHWVALHGLQDIAAVIGRIAGTLGLQLDGRGDLAEALLQRLPATALVLVLDNAEHLPALPALLSRLLDARPLLRVLTTSRERMRLDGEWVLRLGGLAVPDADSRDAESAGAFDAVRLFALRARAARPGFELAPHAAEVATIVERLGGMPLAIELAAAWVRLLPPAAIAAELLAPLELLQSEADPAALPARDDHGSLRSVLDSSYARLSEAEREVLAGLSVFAGGFTRAAAQAVVGASLPVLAALVDKSLLGVDDLGGFALHPVVAAYTAERLACTPARAELLAARHAAVYNRRLAEWVPRLRTDLQAVLRELEADFGNARAAWDHALAHGQAGQVADTCAVWRMFYESRGRLAEGRAAMQPALQLPAEDAAGRRAGAAVRHALGMLCMRLGDTDDALAMADGAVRWGALAEDPMAQVGGWLVRGMVENLRGQTQQALGSFDAAMQQARRAGDRAAQAVIIGNVAIVEKRLGRTAEALQHYREALALQREAGQHQAVAMQLNNIAALHLARDEAAQALETLAEVRAHCRRHGVTMLAPYIALNEGLARLQQAELPAARRALAEARDISRQAGLAVQDIGARIGLARVDAADGDTRAALAMLAGAAAEARDRGLATLLVDAVGCAGEVLLAGGAAEPASKLLAAAAGHPSAVDDMRRRWERALAALPTPAAPWSFELAVERLLAQRLG